MNTNYWITACCGLLLGSQAYADIFDTQESGVRLGFGVGEVALVEDRDEHSVGWNLVAGYEHNEYLAAEVSWVGRGESFAQVQPVSEGAQIDVIGNHYWTFSALGLYPISPMFAAYARLGMLRWSGDRTIMMSTGSTTESTIDGFEPYYGIGFATTRNDGMLRLEYARSTILDEAVTYISFSAVWKIAL
jgi:hypothetical protein